MRGKLVSLLVFIWAALFPAAAFTPAPLNVNLDRPISGFGFVDAFPGIHFDQPVAVVSAPGENNRVFVVERRGTIWAVTNLHEPTRSLFLDLSARTVWDIPYNESGCLGLAFHPGFATNHFFFVYRVTYTSGEYSRNTLSRFTAAPDRSIGDPASEFMLFSQRDTSEVHNAGCLRFGPDGYLYFSIGKDGPPPDLQSTEPQSVDKGLFGGIFRIDVDNRPGNLAPNEHPDIPPGAYKIPADNPWVGATTFLGKPVNPNKLRTEFFAVGLRNAWQFSVDPLTGEIFCGDVGESGLEEVNFIQPGKNYGFPYFEGWIQHHVDLPPDQLTPPLFQYGHGMTTNTGSAVIGGFVVHNGNYPCLDGSYIFGDFGSGNIWKLRRGAQFAVEWLAREPGIAAFGQDPSNGDVLVVNVGEGTIRRLAYVAPNQSGVPELLSKTRIFTSLSTLAVAPGYQPYDINVAFWSDGARKKRWFGLTDSGARYGFIEDANWNFPKGAVWVKHFDLELNKGVPSSTRRLETRLLIKDANEVYGFTYRWGSSVTDAQLVPSSGMDETFQIIENGTNRAQVWHYPARGECHSCHSRNAGFAAGFNTHQLNRDAIHNNVTKNELYRLAQLGYLDRPAVDPTLLRRIAPADNASQPLEHRVKSFFAANCAICHHPDGLPIKARWDARITTPLHFANIIEGAVSQPFYSWVDDRVVRWRNITNSVLLQRLTNFDPWTYHMPPFASTVVNAEAIAMLTEWINTLPDPLWTRTQIGTAPLFGSVAQTSNSLVIAGAGADDSLYFTHQRITNNFQIVARIKNVPGRTPGLRAGLMARATDEPGSAFAAILQNAGGANVFSILSNSTPTFHGSGFVWQRLVRDGSRIIASESADGKNWTTLAASDGWTQSNVLVGFAVSSGDPWSFATVEFDNYSIVSLALNTAQSSFTLPSVIPLAAEIANINAMIARVEFWANDRVLASATAPPWTAQWTNAIAGNHTLRAVAITTDGHAVTSAPVAISLTVEPPMAIFVQSASIKSSGWRSTYGNIGYVLPNVVTNLPANTVFTTDASTFRWQPDQTHYGLDDLFGNVVATSWKDSQEFVIKFRPSFEDPYQMTLCLADYGSEGCQEEITILSDTGVVRDQRTERNFTAPQFLTWAARGEIAIRVRSTSAAPVYLSGIFLDPLPLSQVTLVAPDSGSNFSVPSNIALLAEPQAIGLPLRRVEFYSDAVRIASITNAPYRFTWTNVLAGAHTLTAVAVGYFGRMSTSAPVFIHCEIPATRLTFTGVNGMAKGNWSPAFGSDGFQIPLGPQQFRPFARVVVEPWVGLWEWVPNSVDPRAMLEPYTDSALATCWYSSFYIDATVDFLDGREHPLALYFLDFERVAARQLLQIFDANSNALLDEYVLDDMGEGIHLTWNLRGRIRIRISPLTPWTAIMSGIFVGGPISNSQLWWAKHFGGDLLAVPKWMEDPDNDSRANAVEYALGSNPLAVDDPVTLRAALSGRFLAFEVNAVHAATDAVLAVETSTDLAHWQPVTITRTDTGENIRFTTPLTENGRFYRLRFDAP